MKNFCYDHFPSGKWKKIIVLMRLKLVLLLCSVGALAASPTYSQQKKLDVSYSRQPLSSVLNDLKARTGYHFFYFDVTIPEDARVSVSRRNATLEEVLNQILPENGLSYNIEDNIVTIKKAESRSQQQPVQGAGIIKGVVRGSDGKPVVGASVVLKSNTAIGAVTDPSGSFSLRVPQREGAVLMISFIGKKTAEVRYTGNDLTVTLEDETTKIDDVVVTGIFTRARESYTGAVSTITSEQLDAYRGQNLIQTLANIDPAINIIADNVTGSNPNALPQINIRGNSTLPMSVEDYNASLSNEVNTPLIIMDGFEISLTKLMDYNDDEIESINILKDAAATSIYGSRGANGVIVIISKAPAPGKLKINVQANFSLEMPDLSTYDLLNARELLDLQNRIGIFNYKKESEHSTAQGYYERFKKYVEEGVDTDWLHYPVRTGLSQRYNVRLEGGSNEFRWATSLGYNRNSGAMKGSFRNTFNGGVTLSYTHKNVIFKNQLNIGINKGVESPYGSFETYAKLQPYFKPYDENGKLIESFGAFGGSEGAGGHSVANPLYDAKLNTRNETKYTEIINNFSIEWNILPELRAQGRFGISKKNNEKDIFLPPSHSKFQVAPYNTDEGYFRKGKYTYGTGNDMNYEGNVTINYSKLFGGRHQVYAGVDFSIQNTDTYYYTIDVEGFSSDKMDFYGNANKYVDGIPSGSESTSRRVGFTGNANYTYDNRYYADFSYRMDGSSQFGTEERFAPFWSIGAGWNVHREKFLENSRAVSSLRLRTSYGASGSQNFSAYQAIPTYKYIEDDKYFNRGGSYLMALGNEELKWQTTVQFNAGIEAGFLEERFRVTLDYYIKTTEDLLSSLDLPRSTGFSSYVQNIGEVKNTGFEAGLNAFIIRNSAAKLSWLVSAKISYNKNEITKLSESIKEQSERYKANNVEVSTLFYEGYSQNSLWAVRSLGIDPSTGEELFLDANGRITTEWRADAKVFCGLSQPKFRGNINSVLRYRGFTLNLSFGYHWGGKVYNTTLRDKVEVSKSTIAIQNVDSRVLSARWSKPGDVTFFRGFAENRRATGKSTSRYIMIDNVFQLQSASLQYRLEKLDWLDKAGMQSVLLSVDTSDLFYLSTVKRERGTSYPFARRVGFSIGIIF